MAGQHPMQCHVEEALTTADTCSSCVWPYSQLGSIPHVSVNTFFDANSLLISAYFQHGKVYCASNDLCTV